jgi:hypothetical protein
MVSMNITTAYPRSVKGFIPIGPRAYHVCSMGFNPFRDRSTTPLDIALVAVAITVTLALVLWAAFG